MIYRMRAGIAARAFVVYVMAKEGVNEDRAMDIIAHLMVALVVDYRQEPELER